MLSCVQLVPQLVFPVLLLLPQGRLSSDGGAGGGEEPALAGPLAEQLANTVGEISRRPFVRTKLDASGLERDQMHMFSQVRADHRFTPLVEQCHNFGKTLRHRITLDRARRRRISGLLGFEAWDGSQRTDSERAGRHG